MHLRERDAGTNVKESIGKSRAQHLKRNDIRDDTEGIVKNAKINVLVIGMLPSSELDPRGRPFGWYFICTLRFMPEKWPYLNSFDLID